MCRCHFFLVLRILIHELAMIAKQCWCRETWLAVIVQLGKDRVI
jgi:hypothetical protein